MKKWIPITLIIISMMASGCVTTSAPQGLAPSNIPLVGKKIDKKLGKSQGTASKWQFSPFCLAQYGHPDMHKAVERAIKGRNGNALVNISWYKTDYCLLLLRYSKLHVNGEVVELKDDYEKKNK